MKKRRIVIASILKPVDDTRMLEKMGRTLAASGAIEVFIIGYPSRRNPDGGDITLIPSSEFRRLSLRRLFIPLKVLLQVLKLRPESLIVNTHELLIVALLNRIFFGTRIYYDVRENYYRNLRFSNAFATWLRSPLALWVRTKEKVTASFFTGFFLAEQGYQVEMNFFHHRDIVIENKAIRVPDVERKKEPGRINLLFSGTLGESTGVFEAIRLAKRLHAISSAVRLHIIGSTGLYATLKKIHAEIADASFIILTGGNRLVPHQEVINAVFSSDFGIICYPKSPHTENSIPTKLYEYLAWQLPIILQQHPPWVALCSPFQACLPVDFDAIDGHVLLEQMQSGSFYTSPPTGVTWDVEGEKLVAALK